MLKIPEKLKDYVSFEEGKIKAVDLPPELKQDFEQFKELAEKTLFSNDLAEY